MRFLPLVIVAGLAAAEEPEPGPVPTDIVAPGELEIPAREGGAPEALTTFLAAHEAHKAGEPDAALAEYLRFLGMPGRLELPARYAATVRARTETLLAALRRRYEAALELYRQDRARGLVALEALARLPVPEGRAARAIQHSDRLRAAIERAKADPEKERAAKELEAAIHAWPAALYRYEAKSLLKELGGPDLLARPDPPEVPEPTPEPKKKEEKEPEIEVSDD